MKIITGFKHTLTPEWNQMLDNMKMSAEACGHSVHIAGLPTSDKWIAEYYELYLSLCWKYKVMFMREMLEKINDDLLWIDGDCLVLKSIEFDKIMEGCDVAFTLRDIKDRDLTSEPVRDGYINSGVVFLKNNSASRWFLDESKKEVMLSLYDQEAFNKVILKRQGMGGHGHITHCGKALVKMFNCREYNNFYFDETTKDARIVHFKGKGREIYKNFLEERFPCQT